MKKVLLVFVLFAAMSANSQTGWFLQMTPTSKNLLDIYFINSLTGWACGDSGRIIKTTNGGSIWTELQPFTTNRLNVIRFYNSNYGYAAGGIQTQNPFCIDNDILARTTNGGETWTTLLSNSTWDIFYDLAVPNKDTVFATYAGTDNSCMSSSGGIKATFNSGGSWTGSGGGWVKGISFIDQKTGWASMYGIGDIMRGIYVICKTTNTGVNWSNIYSDTTFGGSMIGKVRFADANTGYCKYRMLRKTTNGGVNWMKIDSVNTYSSNSFALANKDTLWIIKNYSSVLRSNNGGTNWVQQLTQGETLNSIYFTDKNTGWIAGDNGIIYKTITGGAEDMDYATYFPMHTGDFFVYYSWNWPYPNSGTRFKARITKDTIMNAHKYYFLMNFPDIGTGWVRYDSARTNLLYYSPNANCSGYANDKIIDSLSARLNNQVNGCVYHWSYTRCEDTTNQTLFSNYNVKSKTFRHDGLMLAHTRYAKNFGISSYDAGEPPPSTYFVSLVGCYINGILYGDTLLTNVMQISTEIPSSYSLGQNYPNPFNPRTVVSFSLPVAGDVSLKVYDVRGREVQTLVNERLNTGTYETRFDGSGLTSGVYFYRLMSGDFAETKRMLLIK